MLQSSLRRASSSLQEAAVDLVTFFRDRSTQAFAPALGFSGHLRVDLEFDVSFLSEVFIR